MSSLLEIIYPQLIILAFIYTVVVVLVFLDLWAGIRKARRSGLFRSSFGLRKTVEKVARYLNMMFAVTAIDALQMLGIHQYQFAVPLFPVLTLLAAVFVGVIEIKSIYEKAEEKEKAKVMEAARLAGQVITDRHVQEIAAKVAEYLMEAKTDAPKRPSGPPKRDSLWRR